EAALWNTAHGPTRTGVLRCLVPAASDRDEQRSLHGTWTRRTPTGCTALVRGFATCAAARRVGATVAVPGGRAPVLYGAPGAAQARTGAREAAGGMALMARREAAVVAAKMARRASVVAAEMARHASQVAAAKMARHASSVVAAKMARHASQVAAAKMERHASSV